MAVITVATTKGGVGKSTTVSSLAAVAWANGSSVAVFDLDPQHHSEMMLNLYQRTLTDDIRKGRPALEIFTGSTEQSVSDDILAASEKYDLVLVDLQGSANQMMVWAIMESDLVITPVQASFLDIKGVEQVKQVVDQASKKTRRQIGTRVLFVRTPATIRMRVQESTRQKFLERGYGVMETQFVERKDFKELTFNGRFPTEYAKGGAADENVRAIYVEVMAELAKVVEDEA